MRSKTFFSKMSDRHIQLFEHLSNQNQPVTKQELLEVLNTTERTLNKDIGLLNHQISFINLSEIEENIQLSFKKGGSILDVYRFFISQSPALLLMEKLFLREDYTASQLSHELLISETSVYRLIKNLNSIFKEKFLDIQVQTNPFIITGNEREIRYFIATLYLSQLKIDNDNPSRWIFLDLMMKLLHDNQLEQLLSFYNYYGTEIYVFVNSVRLHFGHRISDIELDNRGLVFLQQLLEFDYLQLTGKFGHIAINKDNLVQITFPYFNQHHKFIYTKNNYLSLMANTNSEEASILHQLSDILDHLSDEFGLMIYNRQYLLTQLYNEIVHHYAYGRSFSILFDEYELMKKKFKKVHPAFLNVLMT